MSLRSPLGEALGQGAARSGVHHFWVQRMSAVALVPLGLWLLVALVRLPLDDYAAMTVWVAQGWNPVLLVLLIGIAAWHSQLGVQVVIEDYVHAHGLKALALLGSIGAHLLVAALGILAVLRMTLRSFG
ncbi:MAG: succinate dehydrogenase, hydrophobic membrane anchor protein [Gammaproteobacteria bacterium]|nr:succinate dehydrogenase, hydrophobic membrane anchor protein [Gammaproteobacteria bacterium]